MCSSGSHSINLRVTFRRRWFASRYIGGNTQNSNEIFNALFGKWCPSTWMEIEHKKKIRQSAIKEKSLHFFSQMTAISLVFNFSAPEYLKIQTIMSILIIIYEKWLQTTLIICQIPLVWKCTARAIGHPPKQHEPRHQFSIKSLRNVLQMIIYNIRNSRS